MNFNDAIPNFRGYNGSSLIKQAGLSINWTPEMITELQKCAEDPVYFARTYLKVIHVDHGLVPMDLYDYQAEILENFKNNRNLIIAASRQCGKCLFCDSIVSIRRKYTKEVYDITIEDFFNNTFCNQSVYWGPKFIDSKLVNGWEIETDTGWHDVTHIHKTVEYTEWEVVTTSGKKLISADDHILFDENMNQVFVKNLIPNSSFIMTRDGAEQVVSLAQTDRSSNMYDITVDSDDHRFWSDDILSHNTTAIVGAAIWYATFHPAKAIGILANKGATARQILARIKLAYEHLPKWLQQGVVEWNKGSVQFENQSSILAAASSADNIRGTPLSCVRGDTKIKIRDKETGTISEISIDEFISLDGVVEDELLRIHLSVT